MEKGRPGPGKGRLKERVLPPSGDFIALGSKSRPQSSASDSELKPLQPLQPRKASLLVAASTSGNTPPLSIGSNAREKKKDIPGPLPPLIQSHAKPARLTPTSVLSPSPRTTKELGFLKGFQSSSPVVPVTLLDVSPLDLEEEVEDAVRKEDSDKADSLLCGALRTLKQNRLKPDPALFMTLLSLAKGQPEIFTSNAVTEHLLIFLKREAAAGAIKPKPSPLLCALACNILLYGYQESTNWPQPFIKVFVEDSVGDRSWVDSEHCKLFVDNILTAFGTVLPSKVTQSQLSNEKIKMGSAIQSPLPTLGALNSTSEDALNEDQGEVSGQALVRPRYSAPQVELAIQYYILDVVKEQLNKRQMIDGVSRNMLRFLSTVCGFADVRVLASQRLETWLQNPKLTRPAQDLLMAVSINCNTHTSEDVDVIGNMVKMRLKTKPLANHYISCIKEMVNQHPDNLGTTLKHVIYNELSQQRNPNNMSVLSVIFQIEPENAAKYLALVFQDLLMNREDYLRALRALFREIVRSLRYEINFIAFCRALMQERGDQNFRDLDPSLKERMLMSLIDLVTMAALVSASPAVKEIAIALNKGDKRDTSVLQEFQTQISIIQRDCVWWFHTKIPSMFNCTEKDYVFGLNKVLFLETNDVYCNKDGWPPESDRVLLLNLMREVPVTEDALLRLLVLGLSDEFPINNADTLDVVERLVQRSAALKTGLPGLECDRQDVIEMVLSLCVYTYPKEINLPVGYNPPTLAISNLYWKAWMTLLILAACNPSSVGLVVWESYPTLRCMIEMMITGNYTYPPLEKEDRPVESVKATEMQLAQAEKEDILLFETHLAAATTGQTISESNSLLVNQLISLDPGGPPRKPPPQLMQKLKQINKTLGLGYIFCRSRFPDFLLDIIQTQGSSTDMPWLADLVQASEGSLSVLPAQCLCEFLLMKDLKDVSSHKDDREAIRGQVIARLRSLLMGYEATSETTKEVLDYFLSRLGSMKMKERNAAIQGMQAIVFIDEATVRTSLAGEEPSEIKRPHYMEMDEDSTATTMSISSESIVSDHKSILERVRACPTDCLEQLDKDSDWSSYDWLLCHLPKLQFFDGILQPLTVAIRQAFFVEMDIARLQAYIVFLARFLNELPLDYMNDLTEDLSQLVTTRSTILNGIIDHQSPKGTETYNALLEIYATSLRRALEPEDSVYKWQDNQEMVHVTWSAETRHREKTATLHVRVIHAAIVLLACLASNGLQDEDNYKLLLDTWFPEEGFCEVRLADTGEEALLLQDWLRMKMVRSHVCRLVDAGVSGLVPSQLILFMQTFGLPVLSVSKLLANLDKVANEDPMEMLQVVADRDYMIQLVEVQWARGAVNGEQFCTLLKQDQFGMDADMHNAVYKEEQLTPLRLAYEVDPNVRVKAESRFVTDKDALKELILKAYIPEQGTSSTKVSLMFASIKEKLAAELLPLRNLSKFGSLLTDVLSELIDTNPSFAGKFLTASKFTLSLLDILGKTELRDIARKQSFTALLQTLNGKKRQGSTEVAQYITTYCDLFGVARRDSETAAKTWTEMKKIAFQISEKFYQGKPLNAEVKLFCESLTESFQVGKVNYQHVDRVLLLQTCKIVLEADRGATLFQDLVNTICLCLLNASVNDDMTAFNIIKYLVDLIADLYKFCGKMGFSMPCGVLVDWMEVIDPEVVHVKPILQRELLFLTRPEPSDTKRSDRSTTSPGDDFKPSISRHAMTVLAHQARNDTLQDCLEWILSLDLTNLRLNPSSALDFIASVMHNPRLWRGRDSKRNYLDENKEGKMSDELHLELSTTQICSLALLIIAEIEIDLTKSSTNCSNSSHATTNVDKRLTLLLNHTGKLTTSKLRHIVKRVQRSNWLSAESIQCFLKQLYLQRPKAIKKPEDLFNSGDIDSIIQGKTCQIDSMVHHLMLTVAENQALPLKESKFQHINMICRRLAHEHPVLMLRQLPVFVSLLNGRHRMPAKEFTRTNQMHLYAFIFGILNLLRPYIFTREQTVEEGLAKIIQVFMDLLQSSCLQPTDLAGILNKLVEFLDQLISHNATYAVNQLMKYKTAFEDLLSDFPNCPPLKYLCTFLVMMGSSVEKKRQSFVAAPTAPILTTPFSEKNLAVFRQKLSRLDQMSDILIALKDLDETSKRRIDILQHFVSELSALLWLPSLEVREKAYLLVLRQCRHNARDATLFSRTILRILESDDQAAVMSAVKILPQFLLATNECGEMLLRKLFQLAVTSMHTAVPFVEQCIANFSVDF